MLVQHDIFIDRHFIIYDGIINYVEYNFFIFYHRTCPLYN